MYSSEILTSACQHAHNANIIMMIFAMFTVLVWQIPLSLYRHGTKISEPRIWKNKTSQNFPVKKRCSSLLWSLLVESMSRSTEAVLGACGDPESIVKNFKKKKKNFNFPAVPNGNYVDSSSNITQYHWRIYVAFMAPHLLIWSMFAHVSAAHIY